MHKLWALMKTLLISALIMLLSIVILITSINVYILGSTHGSIYTLAEPHGDDVYDVGMVLGASVYGTTPSPMLQRRLDLSIQLYRQGKIKQILLTGDNSSIYYNEIRAMKHYCIEAGIPEQAIIEDHRGFSTYDSIARAQEVFNIESMVVFTQGFHLSRALYLAKAFGIRAIGYKSTESFREMLYYEAREIPARVKDFVLGILKPKTYSTELTPKYR